MFRRRGHRLPPIDAIEITPLVAVTVAIAAVLIGLTKAGLGGAVGPLVTILVVLALPTQVALGLLLPLLMAGDAFAIGALWRRWDRRHFLLLLPGSVIGIAIGSYLLAHVASPLFARGLGLLALLFVAYWLIEPRIAHRWRYRPRVWHGVAGGALAGFTSALAHSGGPPVAMYLLLQRLKPVPFVATTALLFGVINLIKVPAYLSAGLFDLDLQLRLAWAFAFIPIGIVAGRWLVTRIQPGVFNRVVLVLLTLAGLYLLLRP